FFTAHDEEQLIARSKPGADGSLPSGNAVAAHVLLRLHHLSGEAGHRAHAEEILRLYHDEAAENPFAHATYLQALELYLEGPVEVVVVGRRGAADTDVLWGEVARAYLPHRVLVATQPGEADLPVPARERLHGADRERRVVRDLARELPDGALEAQGGDHAIHEPERERRLGAEGLAGEEQLLGRRRPDRVDELPGERHGDGDADASERHREMGALGRHPEVAVERQLAPSGDGVALHGGTLRLGGTLGEVARLHECVRLGATGAALLRAIAPVVYGARTA